MELKGGSEGRKIHSTELDVSDFSEFANVIEDIYNGTLDVVIVRNAFPRDVLISAGKREAASLVERLQGDLPWLEPTGDLPGNGIRILGISATPSIQAPEGPSLEAYLEGQTRYRPVIRDLFGSNLDPVQHIESLLGQFSGGRPVKVITTLDGRDYTPFTIRMLQDGQGISLHHDFRFELPIYRDLEPQLDMKTCLSFVILLQRPNQGGEISVFGFGPDYPDLPKRIPLGGPDLRMLENRFTHTQFDLRDGDLMVFASGRCFHKVEPVVGSRSRLTMGGFTTFDKRRTQVIYWS